MTEADSHIPFDRPPPEPVPAKDRPQPPYEPPRLIALGSLRNLLGKTGPKQDFDFRTHRS